MHNKYNFNVVFKPKLPIFLKKPKKPIKPKISWVFLAGFYLGFLGWVFWVGFFRPTLLSLRCCSTASVACWKRCRTTQKRCANLPIKARVRRRLAYSLQRSDVGQPLSTVSFLCRCLLAGKKTKL